MVEEREASGGDAGALQASAWDRFHSQHSATPFFKARRYLLQEFPVLGTRGKTLTVLEVGCGGGASALPLLQSNQDVRVAACDFAASAVRAAQQAAVDAGAR